MREPIVKNAVSSTIALALMLVGCSREPVSMALPSDINPVELRQRLDQPVEVTGSEGSSLTMRPGHVGACAGWDRGSARINWTVNSAKVQSTRVEVEDASTGKRQVFAAGGSSGEALAEGWVSTGVTFHLVDGNTNADLASYAVAALPCASL